MLTWIMKQKKIILFDLFFRTYISCLDSTKKETDTRLISNRTIIHERRFWLPVKHGTLWLQNLLLTSLKFLTAIL